MYTNRNQIWRISEQKLEIPDFGISTVRNPHSATSSKTKVLETFLQPETLRKLFLEQWNASESNPKPVCRSRTVQLSRCWHNAPVLSMLPRQSRAGESVALRETVQRGGNCFLLLLELKGVSSTPALLPVVLRGRGW